MLRKYRVYISFIFFMLAPLLLLKAQKQEETDSLRNLLNKASSAKQKHELNSELGKLATKSNPKEAIVFYKQAALFAHELGDSLLLAQASLDAGILESKLNEYTAAISSLKKALHLYEGLEKEILISKTLNILGIAYKNKGDLHDAETCQLRALQINQRTKNSKETARSYNNLGVIARLQGNYTKAIEYTNESLNIKKETNDSMGIAKCLNNLGITYKLQGNFQRSIELLQESLDYKEALNDSMGMAITLSNLSLLYEKKGDYTQTINLLERSQAISLKIGDTKGVAICLANLGLIHFGLNDFSKALSYAESSLQIKKKMGDKIGIANSLCNLARAQIELNKPEEALGNIRACISLSRELNYQIGIANGVKAEGILLHKKSNYEAAIERLHHALRLHTILGSNDEFADTYLEIGSIYFDMKNSEKTIEFSEKAYTLAVIGNKISIQNSASLMLSESFANQGDFRQAYTYYRYYKSTYDTLFTLANKQRIVNLENKFELEKQKQQLELQDSEIKKQELVIERNGLLRKIFLISLVVLLITGFVLSLGYYKVKRNNKIIEEQKKWIEEKNTSLNNTNTELNSSLDLLQVQKTEITDQRNEIVEQHNLVLKQNLNITNSMLYAQRIQHAVLPTTDDIRKLLPQFFLLFKPRNIISGDFYWVNKVAFHTVIVVADCTGHGVPAALMSMLGISFLNQIMPKTNLDKPNEVLDNLRELIKVTLDQRGFVREAKDGIDMALCVLNSESGEVKFAGAHSPIYVVRPTYKTSIALDKHTQIANRDRVKEQENGTHRLTQIAGNRQPIGIHYKEKPFTCNTLKLLTGDRVYLLTDGFADQIGGKHGNKLMAHQFKNLLLESQEISIEEQGQYLDNELTNWQGENEQIDDILVLGFEYRAKLD